MLTTEANNSVYYGIKKLWKDEAEFWRTVTNPEFYLYKIHNSIHNTEEYWLVEQQSDLKTLVRYLKDLKRPSKDIKSVSNITK